VLLGTGHRWLTTQTARAHVLLAAYTAAAAAAAVAAALVAQALVGELGAAARTLNAFFLVWRDWGFAPEE
jgi:hypothetical protein